MVDPLDSWIIDIQKRLRSNWDVLIVIGGQRGVGKSTLALKVCKRNDQEFEFENICYLPEDVIQRANNSIKYGANLIDEAGESIDSGSYYSDINKALAGCFTGNRFTNNVWIFCVPNFMSIDSRIRGFTNYFIDVVARGKAIVYDLRHSDFKKYKYPKRITRFTWTYGALPDFVYDEYNKVKTERGINRLRMYESQIRKARNLKSNLAPIMEEIRKTPQQFKNTRGTFDRDLIYNEFENITLGDARTIVKRLNDEISRP